MYLRKGLVSSIPVRVFCCSCYYSYCYFYYIKLYSNEIWEKDSVDQKQQTMDGLEEHLFDLTEVARVSSYIASQILWSTTLTLLKIEISLSQRIWLEHTLVGMRCSVTLCSVKNETILWSINHISLLHILCSDQRTSLQIALQINRLVSLWGDPWSLMV